MGKKVGKKGKELEIGKGKKKNLTIYSNSILKN